MSLGLPSAGEWQLLGLVWLAGMVIGLLPAARAYRCQPERRHEHSRLTRRIRPREEQMKWKMVALLASLLVLPAMAQITRPSTGISSPEGKTAATAPGQP